jgi:hypothetical protein
MHATTDTLSSIIDTILDLKTLKGKNIVSEDNQKLLIKFRDFDVTTDYIEAKEYTVLGKVLGRYCYQLYPVGKTYKDRLIGIATYGNISYIKLTNYTQRSLDISNYVKKDYVPDSLISGSYKEVVIEPDTEIVNIVKEVSANVMYLQPIFTKYTEMAGRLSRNGKIPKSHAQNNRRQEIKGKIDPAINDELVKIRERWENVIYDSRNSRMDALSPFVVEFLLTYNSNNKSHRDVLYNYRELDMVKYDSHNKLRVATKEEIRETSRMVAISEADKFYYKMIDKLGGFITSLNRTLLAIRDLTPDYSKTPRHSELEFTFTSGYGFNIVNSIVINTSPLGNQFYQYPSTFRKAYTPVGLIKMPSEYSVKKAFES